MPSSDTALGDIQGLRRALEASPFDAIVAASPENVKYIANVEISTQRTIRDRLAVIVWAKGREPVFVLCQVEEGYARQQGWIQDLRPYKEFVTAPIQLVADALRELGLERGHVGIETEYLAAKYANALTASLPGLHLGAADALFRRVRAFKTPRELQVIAEGFRSTERALQTTFAATRVGDDEHSLVRRLATEIMLTGAESVAFSHINAGPNTGFPHAAPTDYRAQAGDIVKADCGGMYLGYPSNIGRTAKLGQPTPEELDTWIRLREIHHAVADMLRPGNTGRACFELATKLHDKHGIPFPYAHNGHSVGLEIHEHPIISPHETMAFEPGMICTVETRVRWPGVKGLHMEDLYRITPTGPELLTNVFDNETIIVI